jgi:hypothetical protein
MSTGEQPIPLFSKVCGVILGCASQTSIFRGRSTPLSLRAWLTVVDVTVAGNLAWVALLIAGYDRQGAKLR